MEFLDELAEEVSDFFEDFWEHLFRKKPTKPSPTKKIVVGGTLLAVRPAYIFAERVDNILRLIVGGSIIISALTASFLGFTSLSDLVGVLIFTLWGRVLAFGIGFSYLLIGLWKILHINKEW